MNRIMLRFRPIAPKPSGGGDLENRNVSVKNGRRTKRKYVRVRGRGNSRRKSGEEGRSAVDDGKSPEKGVATLQLLPERSGSERSCCYSSVRATETDPEKSDEGVSYGVVTKTWMTVECVTEIYRVGSGVGLGLSDRERIIDLDADTCPGFVSDGSNKVVWVNEAYRNLVGEGEVMAWLIVEEKLPRIAPGFACRVRMIQQTKHGHKWNRIVPCDVWRMDLPGFAWKLDVNTSLGLAI